ncbi:hypothetical protein HIM_02679 [Hirsutella minnesotensis 3608]|nr:hypothetical protein HIM_02679 [Hirsutella minnesotensis 3608]
MCQHDAADNRAQPPPEPEPAPDQQQPNQEEPFPWHLGVYDAHCHPTDTMASIAQGLPTMRAAGLAIMATRSQDQHLVADTAAAHALARQPEPASLGQPGACGLVASFGWHPWFSHQLYDDSAPEPTYSLPSQADKGEEDAAAVHKAKKAHYRAVLAPGPKENGGEGRDEDDGFIAALPTPTPISAFVSATRHRLRASPHALVGEVGLDKAFRLPRQWDPPEAAARNTSLTPGGREGRLLSPHHVRVPHQQAVLAAQLRLAAAERRPVSLHGVQAHGILWDTVSATWKGHEQKVPSRREKRLMRAPGADDGDSSEDDAGADDEAKQVSEKTSSAHDGTGAKSDALEADSNSEAKPEAEADSKVKAGAEVDPDAKPYPPRICLHSYSGGVDLLRQWMHPSVPAAVFVSLSTAVNLGTDTARAKLEPLIRAVPDDRILVESDLHVAGERIDAALEDMYRRVCAAKGWTLDDGVATIRRNFEHFVFGRS